MPRCPRCSGFLQVGVGSCPLCRATFAPLEAGEEESKRPPPRRDIPAVPDPDVQTNWGKRATEAGFVIGLVGCFGLGVIGWLEDWFPGALEGGTWLLPLLLILVSPLAGMYTGIAFGSLAVASEPILKGLGRWVTGAKAVVVPADTEEGRSDLAGKTRSESVQPADGGGSPA